MAMEKPGPQGLGVSASRLRNPASFDSRNLGYAKLSDLFQAIDLFEIKKNEKGFYVRDKRAAKKSGQ
ncbi:MAG: hypothetical protein C3F18_06410 [Nitrosomonadales bacterium]|nr:MAG: hypothetical protein C3F18_06410 [Nitrosomonadales bacterium]